MTLPGDIPARRASGETTTNKPAATRGLPLRRLRVETLGIVDYALAWDIQRETAEAVRAGDLDETLFLLEHPHTCTIGRGARGGTDNLLVSREFLAARGIALHEVDRGGDITYHGPGQLVAYPILDLNRHRLDLRWYMGSLMDTVMATLADSGISSEKGEGKRLGVWAEGGKICALGVHAHRWTTTHGLALNVNTDLDYFRYMNPCGLDGGAVTSMQRLLGHEVSWLEVARSLARCFARVFGYTEYTVPLERAGSFS